MNEARQKWDAPLSEHELAKFITYLDDNSQNVTDPRLGKELEFMERNGFDIGLLAGWIGGAVNGFESPLSLNDGDGYLIPDARDQAYIRSVALQIRGYYRKKWNMIPLTEFEKARWLCTHIPLINLNKGCLKGPEGWNRLLESVELSRSQIEKAAEYMKVNYSEIIRYHRACIELSEKQGYTGENQIGMTGLYGAYIKDSIHAVFDLKYNQMIGGRSVSAVIDYIFG